MIQLADISVHFGFQALFDRASLALPPGRHLGLIGQNGSGKSTLLKLIAGETEPTSGRVVVPSRCQYRLPSQEIRYGYEKTTLLEEVLTVFDHIYEIENQMRALERKISESADQETLASYDRLQERFHRLNGYATEAKAREILTGLGFRDMDLSRPVSEFSGGWYMRIALAKILLDEPDCLLLDEPTNHLDMETLVWLENLLSRFRGTMVLVSHDRYFLDRLIDGVIEVENGKISSYQGNYTDYEVQKEVRMEQELAVQKNQERQIAHMEQFIERFRYKASKARQVQSRIKQLSKIDLKTIRRDNRSISFHFPPCERSGDPVVAARRLSYSYTGEPLLDQCDLEIRRGEKAALVGPNGVGKTTLMRLITGALHPQEGSLKTGYNLHTGYFAQQHLEQLDLRKTVQDEVWSAAPELPRNEIRGLLGRFLFSGDDVLKPVSVLSGGEKSRIVLIKLLLTNANFLVLDEPTNHLDMQSKEILASALDEFRGAVLIVSHDRFFLDMLVSKIIYFKDHRTKEFLGNYSEYEARVLQPALQQDAAGTKKQQENDRKTQKRREAEARQARYRALKGIREELSGLEKQIGETEKQKKELDDLFISPEFKDLPLDEMHRTSRQHDRLTKALEKLELRWLELHEEMEAAD
ncbi:MAG: ABC-F family ATP-binding cassette domain-containing protein [Candidatus Marinimicrobia bacterium]|nr:ABC-F family ATP-binding cassette domain-containing protein [Candidatus Neomarinimicrobiota bacterium]